MSGRPAQETSEPASKFPENAQELERLSSQPQPGLLTEFYDFLKQNKKWWLLPILILLALFGLLIALGGSASAPFIYTLF
ncbi:DUF5989 family protein [soil metagenome]